MLLPWALFVSACWPAAKAPASQFPSAEPALEQLRAQHSCSRALRGEAKIDSFSPQGRLKVGALFMLEHPQSLRLDLLSPLGGTLGTLTSDGARFALLDQKERRFYVGSANQCNIERFLQVPVPPAALAQLMAGEAPVLVHEPNAATIAWSDGHYRIEIDSRHGAHETIELEPHASDFAKPYAEQRLRVIRVRVEQQGVTLYEAELAGYHSGAMATSRIDPFGLDPQVDPSGPVCHVEVPSRIRFNVPVSERDVVFESTALEHNPPLLPESFTQSPPAGVAIKAAPCD
ncbi:MAG TPA: lipoprotein insertase outer membrane protein LolB [Polyangiaceae bacterium]|nr:lipoprotein insertase outer membrane protein LolB [Polyangiaceae bacterium]